MTTVLESMARAIARLNIAEQRNDRTWGVSTLDEDVEGAWPDYIPEARAALIALRDGVTPGMMLAGMAAEAPGSICMKGILSYDNKAEPELEASFLAMLTHVLQEGEKDQSPQGVK